MTLHREGPLSALLLTARFHSGLSFSIGFTYVTTPLSVSQYKLLKHKVQGPYEWPTLLHYKVMLVRHFKSRQKNWVDDRSGFLWRLEAVFSVGTYRINF